MENLTRVRIGTDVHLYVTVRDAGVPIGWNSASVTAFVMKDKSASNLPYSTSGFGKSDFLHCATQLTSDNTVLDVCVPAMKQMFLTLAKPVDMRLTLTATVNGSTSTYDALAFTFVPRSADLGDNPSQDNNPINLEMTINEVSSSEIIRMVNECQAILATIEGKEADREFNEGVRQSNEATRIANEEERKTNEAARRNAESGRVTTFMNNEAQRQATFEAKEATRDAQEAERVGEFATLKQNAETATSNANQATLIANSNEQSRANEEANRQRNETNRQNAEQSRKDAEQGRARAEQTRDINETTRKNNETARQQAEATRQTTFESGESSRQSTFNTNETNRVSEFNTLKEQMNAAKTGAETATTNANNAAGSANTAAAAANAAATNAETKTQEALDKVDQAQVIVNAEKLTELEGEVIISRDFVSAELQNGGQITFDPITLSQDGDSLEIEVLPQVANLNAYAMTIGGYGSNHYGVGLAYDRYTIFADNADVQSQPMLNAKTGETSPDMRRMVIEFVDGQIKISQGIFPIAVVTRNQQPITLSGIGNLYNSLYRWYGTIYKFNYTHNGVTKRLDELTGFSFNNLVSLVYNEESVKERVLQNTLDIQTNSARISALEDNGLREKTQTATIHFLKEDGVASVRSSSVPSKVYGRNRVNISSATINNNWSSSNMFATKDQNGVKIDCSTLIDSRLHSNLFASIRYTAEFSGDLYLGCVAKLPQGSPLFASFGCYVQRDGQYVIGSNTNPASVEGVGELKMCIPVLVGDLVTLVFYGNKSRNVESRSIIEYTDLMVAYYDFKNYESYVADQTTGIDLSTLKQGNIVEFATSSDLTYCYRERESKLKCVCMGDSITGMFGLKTDYPSIITANTPIDAVNCGFGGSTIADHPSATNRPFSINRLADAIATGDWSTQDAKAEAAGGYYPEHLANLKAVDFNQVDVVTIFAGTNDWAFNLITSSEDDPSTSDKQHTNIEDAVKYSINRILTAYPNLKFLVISPMWRNKTGTDTHVVRQDSNVTPNSNGVYLYEVAGVIENSAKAMNTPSYPLYWNLGINAITADYFLSDGTHPTYYLRRLFAQKFSSWILENIL